jgi:shikimate dehydrogenase
MKHFALIGHPLAFSLSPEIYRPWFKQHNIDARYEVIPLKENELDSFFANEMRNHFDGINITTPYKEKAIEFVDEISEVAQSIGAINCIKREGNRLIADNTDIYGFKHMVAGINFVSKKIVIVGAGGAAISAFYVLRQYQPDVMNRSVGKILGQDCLSFDLRKLQDYDIIINATTIPLFAMLDFSVSSKILIDLNYKFVDEYRNIQNILTGETMLLKQAEMAFKIWFPS